MCIGKGLEGNNTLEILKVATFDLVQQHQVNDDLTSFSQNISKIEHIQSRVIKLSLCSDALKVLCYFS